VFKKLLFCVFGFALFPYKLFWNIVLRTFQRVWKQHNILCFFTPQYQISCCTALLKAEFFIEPPPDAQRKERQGERGTACGHVIRISWRETPPPRSHSPPPLMAEFMWFSASSAKSEDGLYLGAQKCCSWVQTAFVYNSRYSTAKTPPI
jgi:hypothetical protein